MKIQKVEIDQQESVRQFILPLPRHISIESDATLLPCEIGIYANGTTSDAQVKYAVSRLIEKMEGLTGAKNKIVVDGQTKTPFTIELKVDAQYPAFANRSSQSYTIRPRGSCSATISRQKGVSLCGASPTGLSYALGTLAAAISPSGEDGHLLIPLLEALDYPHIEERGFWYWPPDIGPDEYEQLLDWLYDNKINYWDMMVVDNGLRYPSKKYPELVRDDAFSRNNVFKRVGEMGRERGVRIVAGIVHFEQHPKIVALYPQLTAETMTNPLQTGIVPLCFSREETRAFFADILCELVEMCGVDDAIAWLNENDTSCNCERCRDRNEFTIQAEGIIAAWRIAQKKYPRLQLRILLSQGSRRAGNDEVMAIIPHDVKVSYYNGDGLERRPNEPSTYTINPAPVISPYIQRYVARGYSMGLCADHHERFICGMGLAELTRLRCVEAAEKGITWLNGFLGNPVDVLNDRDRHYAIDRHILAEYAWNPWGRPLEATLVAGCIKAGYQDPTVAAQALLLLDQSILSLINLASDLVARSIFELALSRPLLDQITNVVLLKGLGEEADFLRIEADCRKVSLVARSRNWEGLTSVADMAQASSAIMRLAYPLWRWRENEGWLLSVQGTSVSQHRRRLERAQAEIRAILIELEEVNAILIATSKQLGREGRMQPLAGLWQRLLPEYGLQTGMAVTWRERNITPDEKI